jgi:Mce-associated membrane protein
MKSKTLLAITVLAVLAAGFACARWWQVEHSPAATYAAARDTVREAGTTGVQRLNTIDYRHADAGMRGWRDVSTGALLDRLRQDTESDTKRLAATKTTSNARVLHSAVTALDDRAGTASMMAVVEVAVHTDAQPKRTPVDSRVTLDLRRTAAGWRLSSVATVGGDSR